MPSAGLSASRSPTAPGAPAGHSSSICGATSGGCSVAGAAPEPAVTRTVPSKTRATRGAMRRSGDRRALGQLAHELHEQSVALVLELLLDADLARVVGA